MRKSKKVNLAKKNQTASTEPSMVHAKNLVLSLKKEFGLRYLNALINGFNNNLTIKERISLFKSIRGKKNVTQKRFIGANADIIDMHYAVRASTCLGLLTPRVSRQRITPNNATMAQRERISEMHDWINTDNKTPTSRIDHHTNRIADYFNANVVPSTSGEVSIKVKLTNNPKKVGYASMTSGGDTYSSQCTYRKTDLDVAITLPRNYMSRVKKQGLACVDGLYTLDASTPLAVKIESEAMTDVRVFAATWLESGRGSSYNTKQGFIAQGYFNGALWSFHGKTLTSAVRGLFRKIEKACEINIDRKELLKKAKQFDYPVCIADSYAAGNCQSGTLSFVHRHNLPDSKKATIPLSLLAKCAEKEPRNEVFVVILKILKRHRSLGSISPKPYALTTD